MMMEGAAASQAQVRWKSVALPAEHGGWGFLLEPLLLGLLVAATGAGLFLAVATFGLFLTRQPLKIALVDWRRGKRYARTLYAERFAATYLLVTLLGVLAAVSLQGTDLLLPLLLAVPFGIVQLIYDVRSDSRHWLPEICGPLALATTASSIAVAGGWPLLNALALWGIVGARAIPSVVYVRARLKLEKGKSPSPWPTMILSLGAVGLMLLLKLAGLVPLLAVAAMFVLLVRAAYGLSAYRRPAPAKVIGFQELGFGLLTVILPAIGYTAGL